MRRIRKKLSIGQTKIARERIEILINLAEKEFKKNSERGRRHVELARKIGERCNVRLTTEQKKKFCKKCNQLLISKKTCKIKVDSNKKLMEIKCKNCGNVIRQPYVKKI